jgi:hypothetical protein
MALALPLVIPARSNFSESLSESLASQPEKFLAADFPL